MISNETQKHLFSIGETESITKTITECDVYLFAGITGDFYALHVNEEFAKSSKYGRRIAHGALSIGLISAATSLLGAKVPEPGCVSYKIEAIYRKPIFFGDTIRTSATVVDINMQTREVLIDAICTNQHNKEVTIAKVTFKLLRKTK